MKLPDAARATVATAKITEYLLNPGHLVGRSKAKFFANFGFRRDRPGVLIDALLAHAASNEVVETDPGPFGTKISVEGPLDAPDGRRPLVRAVWMCDDEASAPRFVTAYPGRGRGE